MSKPVFLAVSAFVVVTSPCAFGQPDPKFEMGKQEDVKDIKDVVSTFLKAQGLVK